MRHDRLDQTLQPGALVNEGYLKLSEESGTRWKGRAHFFATAASVMRHILVDRARARGAGKRGGRSRRVTLEAAEASVAERPAVDVLALEEALCELARSEPRQARVVELRYFADMSVEDIERAVAGMLAPEFEEVVTGRAEVREIFKIPRGFVFG
jgi:RNA polymerase sigma factor (TIGR02999 family)